MRSRQTPRKRTSTMSAHQSMTASIKCPLTGATLHDSPSLYARVHTDTAPVMHPTPIGVQSLLIDSTVQALAVRSHGLASTADDSPHWV